MISFVASQMFSNKYSHHEEREAHEGFEIFDYHLRGLCVLRGLRVLRG